MTRSTSLGARALAPIALVVCLFAGAAAHAVEGHVGLQVGTHFWPAYSNRDQVEADTTPGYSWMAVGGIDLGREIFPEESWLRTRLTPRLRVRMEIEVGQRFSDLHGVNDDLGQRTADGKKIRATNAFFNLWPAWAFTDRVTGYLGGGIGSAWIQTLGSDRMRLALQGGAGFLIELPTEAIPLTVDLGWRSYFASSAEYRDRLVDYNTHGPTVGIQLTF